MHPLLPDILLVTLGFLAMGADLIFRGNTPSGFRAVFHVTWIGLVAVLFSLAALPRDLSVTYLDAYAVTSYGVLFRWLFTISALLTVLLSRPWFVPSPARPEPLQNPGEFMYLI